jgi:bacterial/archaeal transporter family-2 protein
MNLFLQVFAIVAGALLPIQAGINAQLAKSLGHPLWAASVSFALGTLALLIFTLALHIPLPAISRAIQMPWYFWIGGLLGVIYPKNTDRRGNRRDGQVGKDGTE